MSMHLPWIWIVPSPSTVQAWPAPPQSPITTGAPFTLESPLSATHLAGCRPETTGPLGPWVTLTVAAALGPESPAVVCATTVTL